MNRKQAGVLLLAVQLVLVLSIGAKYLYERSTRPRVWVRTSTYDPNQPLRGRYLALQLSVDTCGLPRDNEHLQPAMDMPIYENGRVVKREKPPRMWDWTVTLEARDGKLAAVLEDRPRSPADSARVSNMDGRPCDRATLSPGVEYFIPDTARGPFPLERGQELWVEVTVPESGPPRPIHLAVSDASGFHVLKL